MTSPRNSQKQAEIGVNNSRILLTSAILWVSLVFGSYIMLNLGKIWPKLISLVGG